MNKKNLIKEYRISRENDGRYKVHRKVWKFFWVHDCGHRRLKSDTKSTYFNYDYATYHDAVNSVNYRMEFDKKQYDENGPMVGKIFYYPFPEFED